MPAVMIGSVRAVLPRGGQFSVQFGKAPHAAKLVCACRETFEAVISDRKCVSEAIDWLPPGSTQQRKRRQQRQLSREWSERLLQQKATTTCVPSCRRRQRLNMSENLVSDRQSTHLNIR